MSTRVRRYSELSRIADFEERYEYLALNGQVAEVTFGTERYLNQRFYTSAEWRRVRDDVIIRDLGCDLGIEGMDIHSGLYIHHMNPMTVEDIVHANPAILDPEYLITCTLNTHNAIHYGDASKLRKPYTPRRPGDTKLW